MCRNVTRLAALIVAAFIAVACGTAGGPAAPAATGQTGQLATEVSIQDAATLRDQGALVLDVREPDEWASGHIPDATLIPLGELPARTGELPADRTIVVICRSGNRSAQGRDILRAAGFAEVTSVTGGMTDWIAAGLPVESGG
jgi:rhodanese-related sulfurtransferase